MRYRSTLARIAAIIALTASGVVAFATIAPAPNAAALLKSVASIETMPIRAEQVLASPAFYIREDRFQRGDTLAGFLSRLSIGNAEVARLARLRALQLLRPGTLVRAEVN